MKVVWTLGVAGCPWMDKQIQEEFQMFNIACMIESFTYWSIARIGFTYQCLDWSVNRSGYTRLMEGYLRRMVCIKRADTCLYKIWTTSKLGSVHTHFIYLILKSVVGQIDIVSPNSLSVMDVCCKIAPHLKLHIIQYQCQMY